MNQADVAYPRQEYTRQSAGQPWGEAAAVAVLLGFKPVAADKRLARHVGRDGVRWDALLADRTWSSGERFLIQTAAGLWKGRRSQADIGQVAFLDDAFFTVWLAMIAAARTGRVPRPGELIVELRSLLTAEEWS
jgi:hypothetical protein